MQYANMDRRITIGGLVILALLGGYIWYTFLRPDAPPTTPVSTPEPTEVLFLTIPVDQVQSVQVRDEKNNQTTRVVRDGDNWKMEQPAQGEADTQRVNDLVFTLSRITANRQLAPQSDLAQFGLNPSQAQVEIGIKGGIPITLALGSKNVDGNAVYAQKSGDAAVYLIDTFVGETIQEFVTTPPYTPTPSATPPATETPETTGTPQAAPTP